MCDSTSSSQPSPGCSSTTPEQILALSLEQMMAQLKEDNAWSSFSEHYQLVFVNGSFYDRDGRID